MLGLRRLCRKAMSPCSYARISSSKAFCAGELGVHWLDTLGLFCALVPPDAAACSLRVSSRCCWLDCASFFSSALRASVGWGLNKFGGAAASTAAWPAAFTRPTALGVPAFCSSTLPDALPSGLLGAKAVAPSVTWFQVPTSSTDVPSTESAPSPTATSWSVPRMPIVAVLVVTR